MSFVVASVAIGVGVSSIVQYDAARDAAKAQEKAQAEQRRRAQEAARKADEEFNRLNMKKPNLAGIMAGNQQASAGGVGSTMLTGPGGVNMTNSILGKATLLGG
jgi:regulator of protease activity HflC (stomatin/prohibitin superfamily)